MDRFDDPFLMPGPIREDGTIQFPADWTEEQKEAFLQRTAEAARERRARKDADPEFEDSAVRVKK